MLNQSMLQFMPQHGERLALSVDMWGKWVKERALDKLGAFYPSDPDGATPIAYIWARTIRCEGPGCAAEVPLVRSLWLAKKGHRSVALRVIANNTEKVISFEIVEGCADIGPGTVARGSATCPICGYTTPVARVRSQLSSRRSGVDDARLIAVVLAPKGSGAAIYRTPSQGQVEAARAAAKRLQEIEGIPSVRLPIVPDEPFPFEDSRAFTPGVYVVRTW